MSTSSSRPLLRAAGLATIAGLALTAVACTGGSPDGTASTPVAGGILQVDMSAAPNCIDPAVALSANERALVRASVDSLLDLDADGQLVPWLAESWEVNPDATQVVFSLRDDVTFSDGSPFTADDVKASLDAIKALGPTSPRGAGYLSTYTGTTVVDDHTAQVDFSAPAVQFIAGAATTTLGMISSESATNAPEARCTGEYIGTGPFVLDEYVQGQRASVSARDDYAWGSEIAGHDGAPYLDGMEFQVVETSNARAGALQARQTDVALDIASQDIPQLEAAGTDILSGTLPGMPASMVVNTTRPGLDEVEVRRAMMIGFDREADVLAVLGEYFTPATSSLTSTFAAAYRDQSDAMAYDPEEATQLLDDAGWEPGADGIREKNGVRLDFGVNYSTVFGAYYTSVLQLFQQHMEDIGIAITLNDLPQAGLLATATDKSYDLYTASLTDADPDIIRSSMANFIFADPDLLADSGAAELFATSQAQGVPEERNTTLGDIQDTLIDNALLLPYWEGGQIVGVRDGVSGVRQDFLAALNFYDATITE